MAQMSCSTYYKPKEEAPMHEQLLHSMQTMTKQIMQIMGLKTKEIGLLQEKRAGELCLFLPKKLKNIVDEHAVRLELLFEKDDTAEDTWCLHISKFGAELYQLAGILATIRSELHNDAKVAKIQAGLNKVLERLHLTDNEAITATADYSKEDKFCITIAIDESNMKFCHPIAEDLLLMISRNGPLRKDLGEFIKSQERRKNK